MIARQKRIIIGAGVVATCLLLVFGGYQLGLFSSREKFYRKDFISKFQVTYLDKLEVKATDVLACDITQDDFYQTNEDNCQTLSVIYGQLIDKSYVAPVYVAYASPELGYGLFADRSIKKGEMIGEYTGRLVEDFEVDATNKYLFYYPSKIAKDSEKQREFYIDALSAGNYTRFANHMKNPNAERRYVPHNGKWHVIFIAVKDIAKDEQIFIDYGSGYWVDEQPLDIQV